MAKANWLTISPMSGTGNATIRNIGSEHTGRLNRTTTVTGKAVGIVSEKTYSVVQRAKSEFVTVNDASYQVAGKGGTVTVSGISNSPRLTVTVDSGGTIGTLTVNGSQATNGQNISGDPGADAQYTWKVQIQVAENPTANQRSLTVKVQGSSSSIADTIEVVQAASSFTYEYVPSASVSTIAASGGNSVVSAQLKTYRNGSLVSTKTVTPTLTGSATGFSISRATVTAANRGTTVGNVRSIVVTCNYVTSETGETLSDTVTISQAANSRVIVYGKPTITSFEVADIPASGGSVSSGDVGYSQSRHYYYDSGQTEELSPLTTGGQVTFGDAVSAGSLGTTVKSRTIVGQLTCQVVMNGQTSVEGDASVYQQANTATYGNVTITGGTVSDIPAKGGSVSSMSGISAAQTVSFTSGATRAGVVKITYSAAVSASNLTTTVKARTKIGTLTATATGEGSKTATKTLDVYQQANSATYGNVTISGGSVSDIPASGGSVSAMSGISASQTVSFTSGDSRPGSVSISYSTKVEVESLGTTVKNRASVGTLKATATGEGSKSATKSLTVYQAGNYVKSVDLTGFAIAYSKGVSAAGGTVSPSVTQGSVKFTFTSGSTSTSTPSSTYGSLASSITYSGSAANGFSAPNSSSGAMTASDRGTTEGASRNSGTVTATKKVTWTHASSYSGGGTKTDSMTDTDYATQQANVKTPTTIFYGVWQVSVSANRYTTSSSPCPAGGGTCTITRSALRTRTQNYSYTSGATSSTALSNETATPTLSISGTGASLSGTTVTWADRGTTTGNARQATVTATYGGVSATEIVYQQENTRTTGSITYGKWQISVSANRYTTSSSPCPAGGGTCTITASASRTRTQNYSYTSGDTSTETLTNESGTPTLSISGTGASLSGTTVTWANRGATTGEVRQATVTATIDSVSATEIVYQQANSYEDEYNNPVINRPNASHNFSKNGGTWATGVTVSQTGTRTYTSGVTSPLIGSASFILSESADWLTIPLGGASIAAAINTGTSSRSATVIINATGSGGKKASSTIRITQDSGAYLNVSPTSLTFTATGGTKSITIDTNESWTIS